MKFTWKRHLAFAQMLLALALLVVGHFQERAHRTEMVAKGVILEYDYFAPAHIWLSVIDGPPILVLLPLVALASKLRFVQQLAFVLAVGLFWYWIGSLLDRHSPRTRTGSAEIWSAQWWVHLAGLLGCLTLFEIGVHSLVAGGWPMIIDLANMVWALILGFYFVGQLRPGDLATGIPG